LKTDSSFGKVNYKENPAIQWCDSCKNKKALHICFHCETIFCEECFEEHLTIHERLEA